MINKLDKSLIRNIDWLLIIVTGAIATIGIFTIAAATDSFAAGMSRNVKMQLIALLIGTIAMVFTIIISYDNYENWSIIIYGFSIVLLIAVLVMGKTVAEAKSWIVIGSFQFQPAETAKVALILILAKHLKDMKGNINTFKDLLPGAAITAVPLLLILKQPDFGTAVVIIFIVFMMYMAAGISYKLLAKVLIPILAILPPALWMFFLNGYQKKRILVFLNPELDPRGSGYNVLQSIISIGSGQKLGYGIASSNTTEYVKFIPVKESDFIFSVWGRAAGFIGCTILVVLFLILLLRCVRAASLAKDDYGMFVCVGISAMFAFHILENIGMSIGIMPCTGIPLPLISYGGTSLIVSMISIGLVLNICMRKQLIRF